MEERFLLLFCNVFGFKSWPVISIVELLVAETVLCVIMFIFIYIGMHNAYLSKPLCMHTSVIDKCGGRMNFHIFH